MGILEKKNECNLKYVNLLDMLKGDCDIKKVHNDLIELAELLIEIGKISPVDYKKAESKAISLIKMAKSINANTKPDDVYFQLTGEHLTTNTSGELERIRREFDDLKRKDTGGPEKNDIPNVLDKPKKEKDSDNLRPEVLDDYIGQEKVKNQIAEAIQAAKLKRQPLEHMLLFGSAGLGKTSMAKIIANEMNSNIIIMSGPTIKDVKTFFSFIKNVKYGDIVFIDEIHRISAAAAEAVYTVMEDFELSYLEKEDEESRNVTIKLPRFTMIGATTHSGLLEKPLRDRFTLQFKLDLYKNEELQQLVVNSIRKLGKLITNEAAFAIAKRSRGVPRICNSFTKRIFDKALIRNIDEIDIDLVEEYFDESEIDENGLNDLDIKYMKTLYEKFGNHPSGIDNIASCLGEGKNIIESQVEPYLLYLGFVQITASGRILTTSGIEYITNQKKK